MRGFIQIWSLTEQYTRIPVYFKYLVLRTYRAHIVRLQSGSAGRTSVCVVLVRWPLQLVLTFRCSLLFPLLHPAGACLYPCHLRRAVCWFEGYSFVFKPTLICSTHHVFSTLNPSWVNCMHPNWLHQFLLIYKNDKWLSLAPRMPSSIIMIRLWIESGGCKQNPLHLTIAGMMCFLL